MAPPSPFDLLGAFVVFLLGLGGFSTGWQCYRDGIMSNAQNQELRIVMFFNVANFLLGRSQQEHLTIQQTRFMGILFMMLAVVILGVASFVTLRVVVGH